MTAYLIVTLLVFLFLSIIWRKTTWLNIFLKYIFLVLAVWGIILWVKK
jgi:hypothetical protein